MNQFQDNFEYFLTRQEVKVSFNSQSSQSPQFLNKIVPLSDKNIFLYFDNGECLFHNLKTQNTFKQLQVESKIQAFFELNNQIAYISNKDQSLKLINLHDNQISSQYGPQLPTLFTMSKQDRTPEKINKLIEQTQIYYLKNCIVVLEPRLSFSQDNEITFTLFKFPEEVKDFDESYNEVYYQYEYPNVTEQTKLYGYILNEEIIAFCGQNYEIGTIEILLLKPLAKEFRVIRVPDQQSQTILHISPWYEKGLMGIWMNSNESNGNSQVDVVNFEEYFVQKLFGEEYKPLKHNLNFDNDCEDSILLGIELQAKEYFLMSRLSNSKPITQLVNMDKKLVIQQLKMSEDKGITKDDYIVCYSDQRVDTGSSQKTIFFSIYYLVEQKLVIAQIVEQNNISKIYGDDIYKEVLRMIIQE